MKQIIQSPLGVLATNCGQAAYILRHRTRDDADAVAIETLRAAAAALREIDEQSAAPQVDLRCDHCGMLQSVARERRLLLCAPPFNAQAHRWTGAHPSHRRWA